MDGQSAPDVETNKSPKRSPRPSAVSWIMHAGLVVGAAVLTSILYSRGARDAVNHLQSALLFLLTLLFFLALVVAFRARRSLLFQAGFGMAVAGSACMTAAHLIASQSISMIFGAAAIVLCLGGAIALTIETRRLRRAA